MEEHPSLERLLETKHLIMYKKESPDSSYTSMGHKYNKPQVIILLLRLLYTK